MRIRSSVSAMAAMAVVVAGTASAAPVVFTVPNIGFGTPQQTLTITSGDYTLTFTNSSDPYGFYGDSDGLLIGRAIVYSTVDTKQFTMTITGPTALLLKSYRVDYVSTWGTPGAPAVPPDFEILRGATAVSSDNVLSAVNSYNANGAAVWNSGDALTFRLMSDPPAYDPGNPQSGFVQISSLTFEVSASAIPGSGLAALGTLGVAGVARRRRR